MIRLELGTLGIIEGDKKRFLAEYLDERCFKQRKSYDEYYVTVSTFEVDLDLGLLMIIAEQFRVVVCEGAVIIGNYKN